MLGTQIDDPVTMTTPLKADPIVTGAKIHGLQIGAIWLPVDSPGVYRGRQQKSFGRLRSKKPMILLGHFHRSVLRRY